MIKLWLTHKIIDTSINLLFRNISNHFSSTTKILHGKDVCDRHVGFSYKLISTNGLEHVHSIGTIIYFRSDIMFDVKYNNHIIPILWNDEFECIES